MSTNDLAVYEALKLFRDATLAFIRTHLERAYGDRWWEHGVRRGFKPEDMQSPLGPAHPGQELYAILDVPWFTNIFEANWKQAFAAPCHNNRAVLTLLKEVAQLRNPVAHPETGDLQYDDAWRGIDSMERLLRVFDPPVAAQVKGIKERLQAQQRAPTPRPAIQNTTDHLAPGQPPGHRGPAEGWGPTGAGVRVPGVLPCLRR